MRDGSLPDGWGTTATSRRWSCWPCRAGASPWPTRWPGPCAPLDVSVVRKLGLPGHEEVAAGAIAAGGTRVVNREVVDRFALLAAAIEAVAEKEGRELERRERTYRAGRPPLELRGKTVLLVDDGLATGASMRAAVQAARPFGPARLVVAVPVAPADTCGALRSEVDEVVCAFMLTVFSAVGQGYADFTQTPDREVLGLLRQAASRQGETYDG